MRDWAKTLLPASIDGVPFYVDSDELSGGRRAAIHEFAGGETSLIEDQGRRTSMFDVTAYVTGDAADSRANRLVAVLDAPGPRLAILPIDGGKTVHVLEWRRARSKDKNGYIAIDLRAALPGTAIAAGLSLGDVAAAFATGLSAATTAFGGLF